MKKRFVIWTFILLASGGIAISLLLLQRMPERDNGVSEKEIADMVKGLGGGGELPGSTAAAPVDLKRPIRLAIGGLGVGDDEKNRQLDDLVLAGLTGAPGLNLVERQALEAVLREMSMSLSGLVRAQDAVRAGKLLKADWFLLGTEAKINGTNLMVIRVVDARTGIMREAGIFAADESPVKLAKNIAEFVRQCRQSAATAKPRVYLAIGVFQDFSVNNRQAAFPTQLRAYLTAAYQGAKVTLLEREAVEVLLQEVRLDLAGLTEGEGTNAPAPMQSAYWMVGGDYQSFETTNFEVEVVINIGRMFGRSTQEIIRGLPNEALFQKIKSAIDSRMKGDTSALVLSRVSEARAQMSAGKKLFGLDTAFLTLPIIYYGVEQEAARRRRNAEEAIHAFETVLLLEPTNREAKVYLAACLRNTIIGRMDEARNLYREMLEDPVEDQWIAKIKRALELTFLTEFSSPEEKSRWFAAAIQHTTNSALNEFYRQNAESAAEDIVARSGDGKAAELAEKQLFEQIQATKKTYVEARGTYYKSYGLYGFRETFKDKVAAAQKMTELLPKMEAEFPELSPHLVAEVLSYQVDTNPPVLAEYQKQLEWCVTHPQEVFLPKEFWKSARSAFKWLVAHHHPDLAVKTMESNRAAADQKVIESFGHEDQIALCYAYLGAERWKDALAIFDSFSRMPVKMSSDGPWGRDSWPMRTGKGADYCRKKLGLPIMRDPKEFDMDDSFFRFYTPSSFAVGDDGLWIATGEQLLHLDFDLKTNLVIELPDNIHTAVTTLDVGKTKIWIGTRGDGLIEFDKASHQCRHFTTKDGLMMDLVRCTQLSEDALWIGYGLKDEPTSSYYGRADGGIGRLSLSSHQFTSFTRSLEVGTDVPTVSGSGYLESTAGPPRRSVTAFAAGTAGDIWFLNHEFVLRRYRSKDDRWEAFPKVTGGWCLVTDGEHIYTGQFKYLYGGTRPGPLGLNTFNIRDDQQRSFKAVDGLPSEMVTALALDGHNLWVGGMGYIALVEPEKNEIRKFAYIRARTVDKIQIGGGYVWAQFEGQLYRAALADLTK